MSVRAGIVVTGTEVLSGIIREPLAGERARCPVDPDTPVALSSPRRSLDAILRAAAVDDATWGSRTALTLPALTTTPREMARALDRVAAATEQEGGALAKVTAEARKVVTDAACLTRISTSETIIDGYGDLAAAYRVVALGVEQKDEDIADLGRRKVEDAQTFIEPKGSIAQRTAAFRADCIDG